MAFPSLCMNKIAVCLLFLLGSSNAQLSTDFYLQSCPDLYSTVSTIVQQYIAEERRTGASLLRLHFHDCFVNGCEGSILLDDTEGFVGEKNAAPNVNSARGFSVVDDIKNSLERACPGVVSCADILALAARDSVETLGGPTWDVKLGRRDAKTASQAAANNSIPPPTSNLNSLISSFQAQGLSVRDMVALSGSHTIGLARCTNFRARIFNDTNIDGNFAEISRRSCPCTGGSGDDNLGPLDIETSTAFDNNYYGNLIGQRGLLHSDQELFNGGSTDALVRFYNDNSSAFYADFAAAMIKMGDIRPLTGFSGEIRRNCRWPN